VGPGEWVKPRLSQALTRDARPDSNSRPVVQISSPLPSRYAPWGQNEFYGPRWASKILAVPKFYKRCTSWFELEIYYTDFKLFVITLRSLKTVLYRRSYVSTIYSPGIAIVFLQWFCHSIVIIDIIILIHISIKVKW